MGAPQYEQAGADVAGSGTTNTIPRWTGPSTLGDSVITQSGNNIGVGEPSPAGRLQVQGLSGNNTITAIGSTTTGQSYGIFVQAGTNASDRSFGVYNTSLSPYLFVRGDGNVGIGTASPTDSGGWSAGRILDVRSGSAGASAVIYVGDSGRATNTQLGFYGTGYGFVGTVTNYPFRILQNNALRGEWTTTSLDISSTSGYGIKLQGTGGTNNTDPNVLDFYADGGTANSGGVTWTPAITFGGASTGITYQTQVGRYTRVGNMVFATCYVVLTSKGTATGNVKITGLPTSSNTTSLFTGATVGYFANITSTGQVMGYMSPNDTGIILNQTTVAGANTALTDANFANNSAIIVTIAYPVT